MNVANGLSGIQRLRIQKKESVSVRGSMSG